MDTACDPSGPDGSQPFGWLDRPTFRATACDHDHVVVLLKSAKRRGGTQVWRQEVCEDTYDEIKGTLALAIHNNHGVPRDLSTPCFLCRRDAEAVLHRLHDAGLRVIRVTPAVAV